MKNIFVILNSREAQTFLKVLLSTLYLSERHLRSAALGSAPTICGAPLRVALRNNLMSGGPAALRVLECRSGAALRGALRSNTLIFWLQSENNNSMDWVERKRGQFFRYAEIRHIQISKWSDCANSFPHISHRHLYLHCSDLMWVRMWHFKLFSQ